MIRVTRLDGTELFVNADHLLTLERTPDTLITLTNGVRLMVHESVEEIIERFIALRRQIAAGPAVIRPSGEGAES